jgi:hypothetical protein
MLRVLGSRKVLSAKIKSNILASFLEKALY